MAPLSQKPPKEPGSTAKRKNNGWRQPNRSLRQYTWRKDLSLFSGQFLSSIFGVLDRPFEVRGQKTGFSRTSDPVDIGAEQQRESETKPGNSRKIRIEHLSKG